MAAIGQWIANDTQHDVYLLNDLWMRPDHETIRKSIPQGISLIEIVRLHLIQNLYRLSHFKSQ